MLFEFGEQYYAWGGEGVVWTGREREDLRRIEVPVLYVGQTGDWVCRTDLMAEPKGMGLVPDLEEKVIEAGHWCLYECPERVAR